MDGAVEAQEQAQSYPRHHHPQARQWQVSHHNQRFTGAIMAPLDLESRIAAAFADSAKSKFSRS